MTSKSLRRLIACLGFGVGLLAAPSRAAEAPATKPADAPLVVRDLVDGRLRVLTGRSAIVTTERPFKRVAVPDNDVAVAKPLTATTILLTPKKAGSTQLIVWDDEERSQIIDVTVELDTKALADQLRSLLPDSKVEASSANGTIILKGRVPSAEAARQAEQVAAPYGAKVLNFLEISGGQQVMLQVRFAEVSRSATSALGVNLFAADGSFFGGSNIGQISPLTQLPNGRVGDTPAFSGVQFEDPRAISPSVTIFAAGQIGSFYLDGLVQALRQNNLLRILDEPNLLTMSGKEADFLAGGSFPIPVSGGAETGGSSTVTVEFREFGVKLKFLPVVIGDGKIRLQIAPEVSDLDFTTAVRFNGFVIPGLSQRRVNTTVELADGQSFAIAGLLANNVSATKETVPVLGDLPVVGALFRSVRYQRKETELIVLVTPRLVAPLNPGQPPRLPGEQWRHPKEKDLFLDADLGGPVAAKGPQDTGGAADAKPPRFHGSYGFNPVTDAEAR